MNRFTCFGAISLSAWAQKLPIDLSLLLFPGYFENRIIFLTVSQSPNIQSLRTRISEYLMRKHGFLQNNRNIREKRTLVVLDDVWSLLVLEQLIFPVPGCKTLVVSRFKFPEVVKHSYEVELLREDEAMSLFCYSAFGQNSIPPAVGEDLVKQVLKDLSLSRITRLLAFIQFNLSEFPYGQPTDYFISVCCENVLDRL